MVGIIGLRGERHRETPKMEVEGIEGYKLVGLNIDVNGKWGGHRAVVSHFTKDGKADPPNELTFLYILIGDYWKVGKWPDDDQDIPSVWETAKVFTQALEAGVNISALYDAIKQEIETGTKSKEE